MMQNTDTQGLQSKAEARLASLKEEKLVTRIAVLSTSLGQGKITRRLMIGMSIETHKTSPDFDQKSVTKPPGLRHSQCARPGRFRLFWLPCQITFTSAEAQIT
jgi:hypothetical protein